MTGGTNLSASAATKLAHALCHRVAGENGVRVLSIKGPVAISEGLRAPYIPSDADLLVEPSGVQRLVASLAVLGWHERAQETLPRLLDEHSITLVHDSWPCDLDLHRRFPGFLANDEDVFDLMWATRSRHLIAETGCDAPSREFSWAIAVLNDYRDGWKDARRDSERLLAFARERFAEDSFEHLSSLVARAGAMDTLEPAMRALGAYRSVGALDAGELARWRIRQEGGLSPALPLLVALAERRPANAARIAWDMLTKASAHSRSRSPLARRPLAIRIARTLPKLPGWIRLVRRSLRAGSE